MSDIVRKIERSLVAGINDWLDLVFAESQRVVPVRTGNLKKSGRRKRFRDGGSIEYGADYAAKVEKGWKGGIVTVQAHTVRSHRRLMPHYAQQSSLYAAGKGKRPRRKWQPKKVAEHKVGKYQRYQKPFKGRFYLKRSIDKYRPQLGRVIGRRLQRDLGR